MEITKNTIKVLASDTRLEILKVLVKRRKIAADIAKMLDLAPSTVNEHLKKLEEAGLIRRKETGHKWIYFEVTEDGRNLVQPRSPMQFILVLCLGVIMMLVGGFKNFMTPIGGETLSAPMMDKAENIAATGTQNIRSPVEVASAGIDWFLVIVLAVGVILTVLGLYNIWKIRK